MAVDADQTKAIILIIDDAPRNLRLMNDILIDAGYDVRAVTSGARALTLVQREVPDLILLDVRMPGMDGYELSARLKSNPNSADIPILFISGLDAVDDKVKAFAAGGVDYITKPLQVEEVLARVEVHLKLRATMRALEQRNTQLSEATAAARAAEQAAIEAQASAEAANRTKDQLLSMVSHELRTPLTSILGFTKNAVKRLNKGVFPALLDSGVELEGDVGRVQKNLGIVVSESERLTKLINDFLDLAKIQSGRMTFDRTPLPPAELVERAAAVTAALFPSDGLRLELDVAADLPDVIGDRDGLLRVLVNLISNAAKFTDEGSVLCGATQSGDTVVFRVTDTGIGIAAEHHDKLFEPFVQVGDQQQGRPRGTGLGLSTCRNIVERHNGAVWVDSQLGEGATFFFSLPVAVAEQ